LDHDTEQEPRLSKGLIGVVALALLGGAGGTIAYSAFGGAETGGHSTADIPDPEPDNSVDLADSTSGAVAVPDIVLDEPVDGPGRMPAKTDTITQEPDASEPAPPAPKPEPEPPAPVPKPPRPRAPQAPTLGKAAFLVRFNKGIAIEESLATFRKDKDASRKAFADWAKRHPELDGMRLERVNYSGEVILAYDGSKDADPVSNAKQIAERLRGFEAVLYADPDYTAFPGKGD